LILLACAAGFSGAAIDQLIAKMYDGLADLSDQVGGVFQSPEEVHEWYVPVLCHDQRFIMIFGDMSKDPTVETYARIIHADANHALGPNAFSIKYAATSAYFSKQRFAPLEADGVIKDLIRRTVPEMLLMAVQTFMAFQPRADEFYFIAGADSDARIDRLNLWYHRIGARLAASIGFRPVHLFKGDWHGYRKNDH
jgi:hypothetical protein